MHALLISALSLPPRHISDGLPPRASSPITCDTPLSCNAAVADAVLPAQERRGANRAYKICDPLVDPGGPLDPGGDPPRPCYYEASEVVEHR